MVFLYFVGYLYAYRTGAAAKEYVAAASEVHLSLFSRNESSDILRFVLSSWPQGAKGNPSRAPPCSGGEPVERSWWCP